MKDTTPITSTLIIALFYIELKIILIYWKDLKEVESENKGWNTHG